MPNIISSSTCQGISCCLGTFWVNNLSFFLVDWSIHMACVWPINVWPGCLIEKNLGWQYGWLKRLFCCWLCIIGCMVDWKCFGCTVYSGEIVDIGGYGTQVGCFSLNTKLLLPNTSKIFNLFPKVYTLHFSLTLTFFTLLLTHWRCYAW